MNMIPTPIYSSVGGRRQPISRPAPNQLNITRTSPRSSTVALFQRHSRRFRHPLANVFHLLNFRPLKPFLVHFTLADPHPLGGLGRGDRRADGECQREKPTKQTYGNPPEIDPLYYIGGVRFTSAPVGAAKQVLLIRIVISA